MSRILTGFAALLFFSLAARAGCTGDGKSGGILHLDRCDEYEATGLRSRKNQKLLDTIVVGGTVGVAMWEGTDSTLGRQAWKSLDGIVTAAIATEVMKRVFERPRPSQSEDPDLWRQGKGNYSFPSGETATMAAFVTPIILNYRDEYPAVWGLTLLPIYMADARMASRGHWTSDVLAGAAVGAAAGWYATKRDSPAILGFTTDGAFMGIKRRF
jgi:membrane-associated phospholipid phosphatase